MPRRTDDVSMPSAGIARSRLPKGERHDVLAHPRRRQLVDLVHARPGLSLSALARAIEGGWALVSHHVKRLEHGRHVVVRHLGRRTAVFPAAGFRGSEAGIALLHRATMRRTCDHLRENPDLDQRTLAGALRLSQPQVSRILKALTAAGLVEPSLQDGRRSYRLASGTNAAMVPPRR